MPTKVKRRFQGTGRELSQATAQFVAGRWPPDAPGHPPPAAASTVSSVRVGVLTGGGDCPGLNAVIRAIVRKGETVYGDEIVGFLDAWDGVLEQRTMPLDVRSLRGMLPRGGTLLGTKRGSPFDLPDGPDRVQQTFADLALDALIVVGGNGSLTVACRLHDQLDLPIVGVPKTIDNDILGTEVTFGFHTAVQIATDAIDRLHTTAESHDRVMVVEVMGRHAGWIATYAGIAGGATVILVPELPFDIDEVCTILQHRHRRGRYASIVVVAEGAEPREETMERARAAARPLRAPQAGRDRPGHRPGHRGADRLRHEGRRARPRAAGRHAERLRPRAVDPLRPGGHRRRPRQGVGGDGRLPGDAHRAGAAAPGPRPHPHARPRHVRGRCVDLLG